MGASRETYNLFLDIKNKKWGKVKLYPKMFIKGLIESDGCRFNATSSKRKYDFKARYQFTNYSLDIQDLFINYCWLLGLNLKRNENKFYKNIYVYKKRDVDFFDTFIGPKS